MSARSTLALRNYRSLTDADNMQSERENVQPTLRQRPSEFPVDCRLPPRGSVHSVGCTSDPGFIVFTTESPGTMTSAQLCLLCSWLLHSRPPLSRYCAFNLFAGNRQGLGLLLGRPPARRGLGVAACRVLQTEAHAVSPHKLFSAGKPHSPHPYEFPEPKPTYNPVRPLNPGTL